MIGHDAFGDGFPYFLLEHGSYLILHGFNKLVFVGFPDHFLQSICLVVGLRREIYLCKGTGLVGGPIEVALQKIIVFNDSGLEALGGKGGDRGGIGDEGGHGEDDEATCVFAVGECSDAGATTESEGV